MLSEDGERRRPAAAGARPRGAAVGRELDARRAREAGTGRYERRGEVVAAMNVSVHAARVRIEDLLEADDEFLAPAAPQGETFVADLPSDEGRERL